MSLILGIESSCDETAAALVASDRRILAHRIAGQEEAHRPYGGVVPEIAARAHVEILPRLIEEVLAEAKIALAEVDAIAATAGPGLIGGVMVGLVTAKGLALASASPLAVTRPTITPPIRPGPAVAATASTSASAIFASASTSSISRGRISTWARAAISGTTPPKGRCAASWPARRWARTRRSEVTRAAAVSSQLDSMPRI